MPSVPDMKLIINGTLPSLNEIIAVSKKHYGEYSRMKDHYTTMVAWECVVQMIEPIQSADFVITWYLCNRKKNKDNIMAGQKFIFDGMERAGVIENDGWKQLRDVIHRFEVDSKNPRVEVEIKEVG